MNIENNIKQLLREKERTLDLFVAILNYRPTLEDYGNFENCLNNYSDCYKEYYGYRPNISMWKTVLNYEAIEIAKKFDALPNIEQIKLFRGVRKTIFTDFDSLLIPFIRDEEAFNKMVSMMYKAEKYKGIKKVFGDAHICELEARFKELETNYCHESKCDECPLGLESGICFKNTFQQKWELQKKLDVTKNVFGIKNAKIIVTNIKWDTDGQKINLPDSIVLNYEQFDYCEDNDELEEAISDYISYISGYCHDGFNYSIEKS